MSRAYIPFEALGDQMTVTLARTQSSYVRLGRSRKKSSHLESVRRAC